MLAIDIISEWLFIRDWTRTSTGYLSGRELDLPWQQMNEARIILRKFVSSKDKWSKDHFMVRVGLDTSFMAEHYYTSDDHSNNQSDIFKCIKLMDFEP